MGGGATSGPKALAEQKTPDPRLLQIINPLNALVGFASMLADVGHDLSAEQRHRYAVRVRDAADTLERVVAVLVQTLDSKEIDLGESWASSGTFRVSPVVSEADPEQPLAGAPAASPRPAAEDLPLRPLVFVIDADEASRELIAGYLDARSYELELFSGGEEARQRATHRAPDIVLIDPFLDGEDGFAIARAFKGSSPLGPVPVILVTALVDGESRGRARDADVAQIVAKPVNRHELRASVDSLLHLRAQQEELAVRDAQVDSLQRFKDETTAMLIHDLKSPLSAISMNLDFALGDLATEVESADLRSALSDSRTACGRLFRMVANLLDVARSGDGRLVARKTRVDVEGLFDFIVSEHAGEAQARRVTVGQRILVSGPIDADADLIRRVVAHLFENVLRYAYAGEWVTLTARQAERGIELLVESDGRPVSPEWLPLLIDRQVHPGVPAGMNRGMGLYFCQVAVEAHGGQIAFVSVPSRVPAEPPVEPPNSTSFKITLPRG